MWVFAGLVADSVSLAGFGLDSLTDDVRSRRCGDCHEVKPYARRNPLGLFTSAFFAWGRQ